MSQLRHRRTLTVEQEPFLAVRSFAAGYSGGYVIEPHTHAFHQLLYASTGAMTVYAGRYSWIIPPEKAIFIPAGCSHSIRMWGSVAMRSLLFPSSTAAFATCRVLSVTPLLRELILRVVEIGALDSRDPALDRLAHVLLDEMGAAPETPLMLPLPLDARALAVARHIQRCPGGAETIDELSRSYGAARRTLERLFRAETGISLGLWRQKARMLDSIRLLAEGRSVTDVALDSGYASLSAFIAAFRHTFGFTPGRLF